MYKKPRSAGFFIILVSSTTRYLAIFLLSNCGKFITRPDSRSRY